MYKTKINNAKKMAVQLVKDKCVKNTGLIFTDYRGMNVQQISELRIKLNSLDSTYHVIKNRYAKIAFKDLDYPIQDDCLVGPTALAIVHEDLSQTAKVIYNFTANTNLKIKGGLIDGRYFNALEVEVFSKLPSREELIATLMGTTLAPVQNLVFALNSISTKLVRTLQAIVEKK